MVSTATTPGNPSVNGTGKTADNGDSGGIPPFDLHKTYSTPETAGLSDVYREAAGYLAALPEVKPTQAGYIADQLCVLGDVTLEYDELIRAFREFAARRGLHKVNAAGAISAAKTRSERTERERQLAREEASHDEERAAHAECDFGPVNHDAELPIGESLVGGFVQRDMPASMAGPFKGCKTTLALAMAVHAINGKTFLGQAVPKPLRVGAIFGEASARDLQAGAKRVAAAIGGHLDGLDLYSRLPPLVGKSKREELAFLARHRKWDVAIIDPLYRAIGSEADVTSIYSIASRLATISNALIDSGATPVFIHHSNRSLAPGQPMELGDMLGAGVAEFFRAWMLLNRVTPFDPDRPGRHDLVLTHGNCNGDAGRMRLRLNEGLHGSPWSLTASPWQAEQAQDAAPRRGGRKPGEEPARPAGERLAEALAKLAGQYGGRVPRAKLQKALNVGGSTMTKLLREQQAAGVLTVEREQYLHKGKQCERHFVCPLEDKPSRIAHEDKP